MKQPTVKKDGVLKVSLAAYDELRDKLNELKDDGGVRLSPDKFRRLAEIKIDQHYRGLNDAIVKEQDAALLEARQYADENKLKQIAFTFVKKECSQKISSISKAMKKVHKAAAEFRGCFEDRAYAQKMFLDSEVVPGEVSVLFKAIQPETVTFEIHFGLWGHTKIIELKPSGKLQVYLDKTHDSIDRCNAAADKCRIIAAEWKKAINSIPDMIEGQILEEEIFSSKKLSKVAKGVNKSIASCLGKGRKKIGGKKKS